MKFSPLLTSQLLTALISASLLTGSATAFGQQPGRSERPAQITPFSYSDQGEFKRRVATIDRLGRRHLGTPVKGNKEDLKLLQRIADRKLIEQDNTQDLQAMGVVLGDVLKNELGLEWVVYEDDRGRSRAVCVPDTSHCLFPVTMLSRHLEVGKSVDVAATYDRAEELINPYLPGHNPYDPDKPDPTSRPSWTDDRKEPPSRIPIR